MAAPSPNPPLTLSEGLLLLALDDATGESRVRGFARQRFDAALFAAAVADLTLRGRLRIPRPDEPALSAQDLMRVLHSFALARPVGFASDTPPPAFFALADAAPTGRTHPDAILSAIAAHPAAGRCHTLAGLALVYSGKRSLAEGLVAFPEQTPLAAADLVARGALAAVEGRAGLLRRTNRYPTTGDVDTGEDSLRLRLKSALADNAPPPDDATLCLLALVRALGLIGEVFGEGRDAHDRADWRIVRGLNADTDGARLARTLDGYVRLGPNAFELATVG